MATIILPCECRDTVRFNHQAVQTDPIPRPEDVCLRCAKRFDATASSVGVHPDLTASTSHAEVSHGQCESGNYKPATPQTPAQVTVPTSGGSFASSAGSGDYVPSSGEEDSGSDDDEEQVDVSSSTSVFLVDGSQLDDLLKFCPGCGAAVEVRKDTCTGGKLKVMTVCREGCQRTWHSQTTTSRGRSICKSLQTIAFFMEMCD